MPNNLPSKLARRIEVGKTVTDICGHVYRVASKISTSDGLVTFKLANLRGEPVPTPADFHPVNPVMARFASLLRILSYNKDLTKIVNSMIEQHGYPTDPKMDWSAYVQEAMAPALTTISPDFDLQDEAIYHVIVRALLDRNILADFPQAIKKFPQGVRVLPIERQVSEFLKKAFVWRIQEAKAYMQTVQPYEEMSMEQPASEAGEEAYSVLDTEEHATGVQDITITESVRDFRAFREEFYKWLVKKNKASAFGYALLFTIYWEQVQQAEGELKFGDLTQEWLRRSNLGFDSLKTYNSRLPQMLKDFVYANRSAVKGKYELMDLINYLLPKKKEKARPAKASSKTADAVDGDIAQAKSETDSPDSVDPDIKAGRSEAILIGKFAKPLPPDAGQHKIPLRERVPVKSTKPKCPHCGSDDYGLMPTDFETAKCNNCGKNWEHGIVKGVNDPKKAAADLGQCSCEWDECPLGHKAGGCPNLAAHMLEIYGYKTRYCQPCTDATIEYISLEQGGADPDDTVKILSSDKKAQLDPSDEAYGYKCAVCGEENFTRSAGGELVCLTCHPPKRSKEGMIGHDFVDADQQAIRPDITPGDTGRLPHARTQGSVKEAAPLLPNVVWNTEALGQCSCEWENCWGHEAAGCPYEARYKVEIYGTKTRLCERCTQREKEFLPSKDFRILPQPYMAAAKPKCNCGITQWDSGIHKPWCNVLQHPEEERSLTSAFDKKAIPTPAYGLKSVTPKGMSEGARQQFYNERPQQEGQAVQCLDCGNIGIPGRNGACGTCGSEAVTSKIYTGKTPASEARVVEPQAMAQHASVTARSVQVLECCGSITGHHKPNCPVYQKNFDETIKMLPELQKRRDKEAAAAGVAPARSRDVWKVTLRDAKGNLREQGVGGETPRAAERAVQKYMKSGENIVSVKIAAPAPAPAPAAPAAAPAPAPAPPATSTVVAPPPGTPLALQQQQTEEPMRKTIPPEIPNRKYHMTSRVLTTAEKRRLEKW